jgi:hypothetical protein
MPCVHVQVLGGEHGVLVRQLHVGSHSCQATEGLCGFTKGTMQAMESYMTKPDGH